MNPETLPPMKPTNFRFVIFTIASIYFVSYSSCKSRKESNIVSNKSNQETFMNPPVIIYKTKKDYFNYVPVGLSDDKKSVISYPDIADIYHGGKLATPTQLADGYLLDNRGITKNSVFTKYTYAEYSQLVSTPSAEELFSKIIDFEPFTEIFFCNCNRDTVEINRLVRNGLGQKCKKKD